LELDPEGCARYEDKRLISMKNENKNDIVPPRLFRRFLGWFCHPHLLDRIEGDLLETYYDQLKRSGKRRADFRFAVDVLLLLRPAIIKPFSRERYSTDGMFTNYMTVAWRNVIRNKSFSFINIGGLSLGITCSLLIFLWVNDELNIDRFNSNKDLYNVYERMITEGKIDAGPWSPGVLAAELKQQFPEIQYATGVWSYGSEVMFNRDDKKIFMKGIAADSDFFKMFNYKLLKGDPESALSDATAVAISRRMAEAFFGTSEAAYGNTIQVDNSIDLKITAVFENVPDNASQQFEFVINWTELLNTVGWLKSWIYRGPFTYIQLYPGSDPGATEAKIKDFLNPFLKANTGEGYKTELGLQSYGDMYLYSSFTDGVPQGGRIEYVRMFGLIAVFILIIACINFMNLSTARSVKRAKEVGIRKTMGAVKSYLVTQFIGEAMLLTFMATVFAFTIVALILPYFNLITNKHIVMPVASLSFWGSLAALIFLTGLIAGAYPAFFLSSLNSIKILKGSLKADPKALLFRKGLVIFQFILVIAFIGGTLTISRQVDYMQSKNLGFDKENLLYIPFQGDLISKYEVFKERVANSEGVESVSRSTNAPSHINTHEYDLSWEGKSEDEKVVAIHNGVGYEFLPMMNITVLEGRNFSKDFISDSSAFIINETALKIIGYDDPIGKPLDFLQRRGTIIGVVKDFHLKSVREPIMPLIMYLGEHATWGYIVVKTKPGQTQQAIASVESVLRDIEPAFPLRYYFVDEEFQKQYNGEQTVNKLSISFSILAIFIACLGLLGLTMFTVEQRAKEIGVRKAIGATTINIVGMLSNDIVKLVMIAALFATPVAWMAMNRWLAQFAYQVDVSWWLVILPAVATLFIALITVSYQAIKAGLANPVKSLRSE
jgi:putative ABC transport system permease protein